MDPHPIIVLVTAPDNSIAMLIARHVVESRLAACCNILPGIQSVYRWEDNVNEDSEFLLIIKSTPERFSELESAIRQLHPYEVPEIIAFPIAKGSQPYLDWLVEATSKR